MLVRYCRQKSHGPDRLIAASFFAFALLLTSCRPAMSTFGSNALTPAANRLAATSAPTLCAPSRPGEPWGFRTPGSEWLQASPRRVRATEPLLRAGAAVKAEAIARHATTAETFV